MNWRSLTRSLAYAASIAALTSSCGAQDAAHTDAGTIDPPIGDTRTLEQIGEALADLEGRRTVGKTVLTLR